VRQLLICLGLLGAAPASAQVFASLPDNPVAFGNCTARVKVDAARLRAGPSLKARILGLHGQDEPMHALKVVGKWVQVETASGDTGYVAAYLLAFPVSEILEQWKKEGPPPPALGKKARVKWAAVNFRRYPSAASPVMGRFERGDMVAVLDDVAAGWSLVEGRKADGSACVGFLARRALVPPSASGPPQGTAPLARLRPVPGVPGTPAGQADAEPARESLEDYCKRTAWTPERFLLELARSG
jgi:hypothetical protein